MFSFLSRSWWLPFASGIAAIIFGLLAIIMPGTTISLLLVLFAIFLILQGAGLLWSASKSEGPASIALCGTGLLLIVFAIWTLVATDSAAELLVTIMGIWALAIGVTTGLAGYGIRGRTDQWTLPFIGGIIMAGAGILVILRPWAGVAAIAITIGVGSILWGGLMASIGWTLKSILPGEEEPRR